MSLKMLKKFLAPGKLNNFYDAAKISLQRV